MVTLCDFFKNFNHLISHYSSKYFLNTRVESIFLNTWFEELYKILIKVPKRSICFKFTIYSNSAGYVLEISTHSFATHWLFFLFIFSFPEISVMHLHLMYHLFAYTKMNLTCSCNFFRPFFFSNIRTLNLHTMDRIFSLKKLLT